MQQNYYILLDKYGQLPGYPLNITKQFPGHPLFFDYVFDCEKYNCSDDTFFSCKGNKFELYVKHKKISFDYYPARSTQNIREFFVSEEFLNIIKLYKSSPFRYKPITFLGKNQRPVSDKKYFVASFYDILPYVNRKKCLYVIPDGHEVFERNLIEASIDYKVLKQFDLVPSILPTFPSSLIVSEKIKNNEFIKKMNLKFLLLKESPLILFKKEEGNIYDIDKLKKYYEDELNKM